MNLNGPWEVGPARIGDSLDVGGDEVSGSFEDHCGFLA